MSNKFSIFNFQFSILIAGFVLLLLLLSPVTYNLKPILAQTSACGAGTTNARATGLVSTASLTSGSKFGTSGACVVDPKAAFVPFRIPTFSDLKSLYFDQSKAAKSTITAMPAAFSSDRLYAVSGNLTVSSTPAGSGTQVIFVDGELNITANYTYGTATTGTVFIAGGNVNIAQSVSRIDAVIVAQGTIYTAGASCAVNNVPASALTINGSLVSLNPDKPIRFCRTLSDNANPAERINHQVKYLVILRDLMSDTLQRWSEIP